MFIDQKHRAMGIPYIVLAMMLVLTACGSSESDEKVREAVTVNQRNITALELSSANSIIETGTSQFYNAVGIVDDGNGTSIDVSDDVRWSTSDASIASINQSGNLTGHQDGMVDVRIELADLLASVELQVSSAPLDSITISDNPSPVSVCTHGYQLKAMGDYDDGQAPRDITDLVTWASSDVNLASITQDGVLATFGDGGVTLSATRANPDGSGDVIGSDTLTIDNDIQSLALEVGSGTVAVNDDLQARATGTYPGGVTADVTETSTWSSSDTGIFTVSDEAGEKGLVLAQAEGTADLTAECNVTTPTTASEALSVTAAVIVNGITVNRGQSNIEYDLNESPVQLTANLLKSDGSLSTTVTDSDDTIWTLVRVVSGEGATISNETATKGELTFTAEGITVFSVRYDRDDGNLGPFEKEFEVEVVDN